MGNRDIQVSDISEYMGLNVLSHHDLCLAAGGCSQSIASDTRIEDWKSFLMEIYR